MKIGASPIPGFLPSSPTLSPVFLPGLLSWPEKIRFDNLVDKRYISNIPIQYYIELLGASVVKLTYTPWSYLETN